MQGHVIVCGLQGVGLRAVEQFHLSGTQVVVIDDDADPRRWRTLDDWGVPHVRRHAHRGEGFEEAGLARAAAVVCVEVDEIHTLETALRIKEIRPDLPLVVQLANPSVARALERVSGPGSVLDVASLAAPSFVEACLLRPSHAIELAGIDFAVVKLDGRGEPSTRTTPSGPTSATWPPWRSCPSATPRWRCARAATTRCTAGTGWPSSARVDELQRMEISHHPAGERSRRARWVWAAASGCRSASRSRRATAPWPSWPRRCSRSSSWRRSCCTSPSVPTTATPTSASSPPCTSPWRPWRPSGYGDYSFSHQSPWLIVLRHRPHRLGRGAGVDRVRALHQHSGEPSH